MDIMSVPFEELFTVELNGEKVQIIIFKTLEQGNIKFGVEAPKSIKIHREEIYQAIKEKKAGVIVE